MKTMKAHTTYQCPHCGKMSKHPGPPSEETPEEAANADNAVEEKAEATMPNFVSAVKKIRGRK